MGLHGTWRYEFTPEGDGTRLTMRGQPRGLCRLPGVASEVDRVVCGCRRSSQHLDAGSHYGATSGRCCRAAGYGTLAMAAVMTASTCSRVKSSPSGTSPIRHTCIMMSVSCCWTAMNLSTLVGPP